jgi:hypothetical protein
LGLQGWGGTASARVLLWGHHLFGVLIDTQAAELQLSQTDAWSSAASLDELQHGLPKRLAILHTEAYKDLMGFFALCATNRGFHVETFTSLHRAVAWLTPEI